MPTGHPFWPVKKQMLLKKVAIWQTSKGQFTNETRNDIYFWNTRRVLGTHHSTRRGQHGAGPEWAEWCQLGNIQHIETKSLKQSRMQDLYLDRQLGLGKISFIVSAARVTLEGKWLTFANWQRDGWYAAHSQNFVFLVSIKGANHNCLNLLPLSFPFTCAPGQAGLLPRPDLKRH